MMKMNPIKTYLEKYSSIVIDGAMASELEKKGCNINDGLWSAKILAENPEMIRQVHLDYFKAGADFAITASYQATIDGFVKKGYSQCEAQVLIQKSVQIAKEAREEFIAAYGLPEGRPYPLVAASIGPYGAYLADGSEYRGDYGIQETELMDFHRERMDLLIQADPDLLACETIPNLDEAKAIAKLMEELNAPYGWISFSCKNGTQISSGDLIRDCVSQLENFEKVAAIGINCTSPEYISSLIQEIKSVTAKPIIVYPNSGEEYHADTKTWTKGSEQGDFCSCAKRWHREGARLIGGCCQTTPEHIKSVTDYLRNQR